MKGQTNTFSSGKFLGETNAAHFRWSIRSAFSRVMQNGAACESADGSVLLFTLSDGYFSDPETYRDHRYQYRFGSL